MPDKRTGDRHSEQPLTVRFGPDRPRLEKYAEKTGQRIRSVVRLAVRKHLDEAEQANPRDNDPANLELREGPR